MYTSYFGNPALKGRKDLVAISQSTPAAWVGMRYKKLAPPWALVSDYKAGKIDWHEYTEAYYRLVLDNLKPREVIADLGIEAILLCWEKPGKPCHRRIVATWIEDAAGIAVPELNRTLTDTTLAIRTD